MPTRLRVPLERLHILLLKRLQHGLTPTSLRMLGCDVLIRMNWSNLSWLRRSGRRGAVALDTQELEELALRRGREPRRLGRPRRRRGGTFLLAPTQRQIGGASCRERVGQYV